MSSIDIKKELFLATASIIGNPTFILVAGTAWEVGKMVYEKSNNSLSKHIYEVTHEFLLALSQNQEKILQEIDNDSSISIASAKLYQAMIQQRFKIKRQKAINILRDFVYTKKEERDKFEIEKMYHVLDLLSLDDLAVLKDFEGQLCLDEIASSDEYAGLLSTGVINLEIEYYNKKIDFEKDEFNSINPEVFHSIQDSLNDQITPNMSLRYELTSFGQKFKDCVFPFPQDEGSDNIDDVEFVLNF
jgi:hypothetical protein